MRKALFADGGWRFSVITNGTPADIEWIEKSLRCKFIKFID